jgi:hypothetical protein
MTEPGRKPKAYVDQGHRLGPYDSGATDRTKFLTVPALIENVRKTARHSAFNIKTPFLPIFILYSRAQARFPILSHSPSAVRRQ